MPSVPLTLRRLNREHNLFLRKLNIVFGDAFDDPKTYVAEAPTDAYAWPPPVIPLSPRSSQACVLRGCGEQRAGGTPPRRPVHLGTPHHLPGRDRLTSHRHVLRVHSQRVAGGVAPKTVPRPMMP